MNIYVLIIKFVDVYSNKCMYLCCVVGNTLSLNTSCIADVCFQSALQQLDYFFGTLKYSKMQNCHGDNTVNHCCLTPKLIFQNFILSMLLIIIYSNIIMVVQ